MSVYVLSGFTRVATHQRRRSLSFTRAIFKSDFLCNSIGMITQSHTRRYKKHEVLIYKQLKLTDGEIQSFMT